MATRQASTPKESRGDPVNFAFLVVLVAAVSGLASLTLLRTVFPGSGPAVALAIMAVALIMGARRRRSVERAASREPAGESIQPA
jgi:hypothetical protein